MVDFNFEKNFKNPIIGIDEVGRGSWAGPVMAGAALIDYQKPLHAKLNDSKKLSSKTRYEVLGHLKKNAFLGIGVSSNNEIDAYGITQATFNAMERAFLDITKKINLNKVSTLLIDGTLRPNFKNILGANIILIKKGDEISPSIAAASIFAKCTRDLFMLEMNEAYEGYGFETNMGYGTKIHRNKLFESGPTQLHRMTFLPMKNMH